MGNIKYTFVRFYNTTKQEVMNKVFTAREYEQVGKDVDACFYEKRLAKQAIKNYGGKCEIIDVDLIPLNI